jgi:hypothetical protein
MERRTADIVKDVQLPDMHTIWGPRSNGKRPEMWRADVCKIKSSQETVQVQEDPCRPQIFSRLSVELPLLAAELGVALRGSAAASFPF